MLPRTPPTLLLDEVFPSLQRFEVPVTTSKVFNQSSLNSPTKNWRVNIPDFVGYMVSVATTGPCLIA